MSISALDIKQLRRDLNLTQQELARKLGISRSHVYRLESGRWPIQKQTELALLSLIPHH